MWKFLKHDLVVTLKGGEIPKNRFGCFAKSNQARFRRQAGFFVLGFRLIFLLGVFVGCQQGVVIVQFHPKMQISRSRNPSQQGSTNSRISNPTKGALAFICVKMVQVLVITSWTFQSSLKIRLTQGESRLRACPRNFAQRRKRAWFDFAKQPNLFLGISSPFTVTTKSCFRNFHTFYENQITTFDAIAILFRNFILFSEVPSSGKTKIIICYREKSCDNIAKQIMS